jgi:hypothetical protein
LPMSMPIEAKGDMVVSMGCFSGCCGVVLDYPRGGSSRSIPLAELCNVTGDYIIIWGETTWLRPA